MLLIDTSAPYVLTYKFLLVLSARTAEACLTVKETPTRDQGAFRSVIVIPPSNLNYDLGNADSSPFPRHPKVSFF